MKKIILGITAIALGLTMTACGTSANDAAVKNLSNQLDDTANTLADINTINPNDISMSKDTLSALATKDEAIYDNMISTQQSLLNEEYYKADILSRTSKLKSCVSKDIKLSKAQISAVKDLTTNLSKYTNSVSYTESELNSAVKSVASMKKNASKNSDKINAKLNRIACNSNTRSAYYENIINTLNELENLICCENCAEDSTTEETSFQTYTTNETDENNSTEEVEKSTKKGLPINIDTYAPNNRNIDTIGYNMMYGNRMRNAYGYGYGYNGSYGNGAYGDIYGYNRAAYPYPSVYPYQNMAYNSNNINRMAYGAVPVVEISDENVANERLEDFEEIKDGQLQKIDQKQSNKKQESSLTTNSIEKISNQFKEPIEKSYDSNEEKFDKILENSLSVTAREIKKIKNVEDTRTPEEIQKDLDQPIIAH